MFFLSQNKKKDLDITDALKRKQAEITIGGKPVVIKACKLPQALDLLAALGDLRKIINLAQNDFAAFNKFLLNKLPEILKFCLPDENIKADDITLSEFADLITAFWCVNDLGRILLNFTQAIPPELMTMPNGAVSPKQ